MPVTNLETLLLMSDTAVSISVRSPGRLEPGSGGAAFEWGSLVLAAFKSEPRDGLLLAPGIVASVPLEELSTGTGEVDDAVADGRLRVDTALDWTEAV